MLQGAPNFRDLGGCIVVNGGTLRRGMVFRSQSLCEATDGDLEVVAGTGIGAVLDLRASEERARRPNRWPAGSEPRLIALPPPPGAEQADPEEWKRKVLDPGFDAERAKAEVVRQYRKMPKHFAPHLSELFAYLARPENGPILIHCEAGKDRTGFVCAMLMLALGAGRETVFADYLLSRKLYVIPDASSKIMKLFGQELPARAIEALRMMVAVRAEYLEAALQEIESTFGSMEAYLMQAAGVTPSTMRAAASCLVHKRCQ